LPKTQTMGNPLPRLPGSRIAFFFAAAPFAKKPPESPPELDSPGGGLGGPLFLAVGGPRGPIRFGPWSVGKTCVPAAAPFIGRSDRAWATELLFRAIRQPPRARLENAWLDHSANGAGRTVQASKLRLGLCPRPLPGLLATRRFPPSAGVGSNPPWNWPNGMVWPRAGAGGEMVCCGRLFCVRVKAPAASSPYPLACRTSRAALVCGPLPPNWLAPILSCNGCRPKALEGVFRLWRPNLPPLLESAVNRLARQAVRRCSPLFAAAGVAAEPLVCQAGG